MEQDTLTAFDDYARGRVISLAMEHPVVGLLHRGATYNHGGCQAEWRRDRHGFRLPWKRSVSHFTLCSPGPLGPACMVDAVLAEIVEAVVAALMEIGTILPATVTPEVGPIQRIAGADNHVTGIWNEPTDYGSRHWPKDTGPGLRPDPWKICHNLPGAWNPPEDALRWAFAKSHGDFFLMAPVGQDHPWKTWAARKGITVGESPHVPTGTGFLFPESALEMRYMTSQAVKFDSENGGVRAEAYFAPVFADPCKVVSLVPATKFEMLVAR